MRKNYKGNDEDGAHRIGRRESAVGASRYLVLSNTYHFRAEELNKVGASVGTA